MRSVRSRLLLAAALMAPAAAARAGWLDGAEASADIVAAHAAYVRGDDLAMMLALKAVLERHPDDATTTDNALQLLAAAYRRAGKRGMPLDWHVPSSFTLLKFGVVRINGRAGGDRRPQYQLELGLTGTYRTIDDLHVETAAGEVMIDKKAGVYWRFSEYEREHPGREFRGQYRSKFFERPVAPGLYRFKIHYDGDQEFSGWFIGEDWHAGSSPLVAEPRWGDVITGRPTIRWAPSRSIDRKAFETACCILRVTPSENQWSRWVQSFSEAALHREADEPIALTLGDDSHGIGSPDLDRGDYTLGIRCDVDRRQGDLVLSREGRTTLPISIVKP